MKKILMTLTVFGCFAFSVNAKVGDECVTPANERGTVQMGTVSYSTSNNASTTKEVSTSNGTNVSASAGVSAGGASASVSASATQSTKSGNSATTGTTVTKTVSAAAPVCVPNEVQNALPMSPVPATPAK